MGKIFYIMGKSSSGKDTIYQRLIQDEDLSLHKVLLYTTRPIREGEQNGVEYYFTDEEGLRQFEREGRLIELRSYETIHGVWHYFTVEDGSVDLEKYNYLMHGTLESYQKLRVHYGKENLAPIYVEVEDGLRLMRALLREREQKEPKYAELCRRFLADEKDFSEEHILECEIKKRYENVELEACLQEIKEDIGKLI